MWSASWAGLGTHLVHSTDSSSSQIQIQSGIYFKGGTMGPPLLQALSGPPLYLPGFVLPLIFCGQREDSYQSAGESQIPRVYCFQGMSQPLFCLKTSLLWSCFPALGHSFRSMCGSARHMLVPQRMIRNHRTSSKHLASSTSCMVCSPPGQLAGNVEGVLDPLPFCCTGACIVTRQAGLHMCSNPDCYQIFIHCVKV